MHRPESRWDSNFRVSGIVVVWTLTVVMFVGAAVFDSVGKANLLFIVAAAPFALTTLLIGGLVHAWKHFLSAWAALGLWFAVLPVIRWGPLKGFYMDCGRIEPGMPVARAAKIMSPYLLTELPARLEQDLAEVRRSPWLGPPPEAEPDRILFIPDRENPGDWCIVYTSGQVVRVVEASPD